MKTFLKPLIAVAVAAGFAVSASATPELWISDGVNTVTITDNLAGDLNAAPGVILFSGSDSMWSVYVTTGISDVPGNSLDLSISAQSTAAATSANALMVRFSDTGFTSMGSAYAAIGGTTGGTVTFKTFGDAGNTVLTETTPLTTQSFSYPPTSFSGEMSGGAMPSTPYSLTEDVVISHSGSHLTSLDASLSVPDSGTTALLLGLGVLGIALAMLRFKSVKA